MCWHGYLSEARRKAVAHDPADATGTLSSLALVKSQIVYPFVTGLTPSYLQCFDAVGWVSGRASSP